MLCGWSEASGDNLPYFPTTLKQIPFKAWNMFNICLVVITTNFYHPLGKHMQRGRSS